MSQKSCPILVLFLMYRNEQYWFKIQYHKFRLKTEFFSLKIIILTSVVDLNSDPGLREKPFPDSTLGKQKIRPNEFNFKFFLLSIIDILILFGQNMLKGSIFEGCSDRIRSVSKYGSGSDQRAKSGFTILQSTFISSKSSY